MPGKAEFRTELRSQLRAAQLGGLSSIDINSGALHRQMGGYPNGGKHQMPSCCDAMYEEKQPGDELMSAPTKHKGASVTIRYRFPRP